MSGAVPAELVAKLSALKTRMPSYTKDEIQEVVTEMLSSMEGDLSEMNLKLYAEVESLARYIVTAKSEIAALRPDEIMSDEQVIEAYLGRGLKNRIIGRAPLTEAAS